MNRYPLWKYILIAVVLLVGLVFALPNVFPESPAVQVSSSKTGDFAAFVRYREPGVNLRLMRGGRLQGRYPHLEGRIVKRMQPFNELAAVSSR